MSKWGREAAGLANRPTRRVASRFRRPYLETPDGGSIHRQSIKVESNQERIPPSIAAGLCSHDPLVSVRRTTLPQSNQVCFPSISANFNGGPLVLTFGFSAFLKILSLNDKAQRAAIRRRLGPSTGKGYDFHKRFRQLAHHYLVGAASLPDVIASAQTIVKSAERTSAVSALERLGLWDTRGLGGIIDFAPAIYESPNRLFRLKFEPDFGMWIDGKATAFHLWNTKSAKLTPNVTYGALALVAQAFQSHDSSPDDVGVFSLREPSTVYLLSQASDHSAVATSIVEQIEEFIRGPMPPSPPPEARPFA